MKTIWKYHISDYGLTLHEIPKDAEIFVTYGTGRIVAEEDKTYIGTAQLEVFERKEEIFENSNNND